MVNDSEHDAALLCKIAQWSFVLFDDVLRLVPSSLVISLVARHSSSLLLSVPPRLIFNLSHSFLVHKNLIKKLLLSLRFGVVSAVLSKSNYNVEQVLLFLRQLMMRV